MPINKNAVLRYNVLDKCLRNTGKKYHFHDLLEEVNKALSEENPLSKGIKIRQLRDDIRYMRSETGYSAPIVAIREGKTSIYRYEDPRFSINNSPINATETEQLKNALMVLRRFQGSPQFEWIQELIPLLSSSFGLGKSQKPVMAFDSNIDYSGYDLIEPIFTAIVNRQVLEVKYKAYKGHPFSFIFHPYYLKQSNYRWWVLGLNEKLKIPTWTVALDRIQEFKVVKKKYIDTDIDWEEYFYDFIGVTRNEGDPEEVELLFTEEQAPYVETKPLHPTQRAKRLENGQLRVILKLIPNYELEMKLLSFGEKVIVIRPGSLKERIAERLKKACENYS